MECDRCAGSGLVCDNCAEAPTAHEVFDPAVGIRYLVCEGCYQANKRYHIPDLMKALEDSLAKTKEKLDNG